MLRSQFANLPSALAHPLDVGHYIATELGHGALLGPFDGPPAATCHFSPLMTRLKKGSRFRRVIIDLSWPRGQSVNDGISRTEYVDSPMTISLPTHDDMERAIVHLGRGSFLYKTDLARGYRQLRVDPLDWPVLSFQHNAKCYMDICPPFGLCSSAIAMQRVSEALLYLHAQRGFISKAYIDNFGGAEVSEHKATNALRALQAIMDGLGVVQAEAKICLPAQTMTWLGIYFDTMEMSMSVPKPKLAEIMICLGKWHNKIRAIRATELVARHRPGSSPIECSMHYGRHHAQEPPPCRVSLNLSSSSLSCCPCLKDVKSWASRSFPISTKWNLMPALPAAVPWLGISFTLRVP